MTSFQDNLGKLVWECRTIQDPAVAQDDWCSDNWNLKVYKTLVKSPPLAYLPSYLQARCLSCHPTNSFKALKIVLFTALSDKHEQVTHCQPVNLFYVHCVQKKKHFDSCP